MKTKRNASSEPLRPGGTVTTAEAAERARRLDIERRILGGALRSPRVVADFLEAGVGDEWFTTTPRLALWRLLRDAPKAVREGVTEDAGDVVAALLDSLDLGRTVARAIAAEAKACIRAHKGTSPTCAKVLSKTSSASGD